MALMMMKDGITLPIQHQPSARKPWVLVPHLLRLSAEAVDNIVGRGIGG